MFRNPHLTQKLLDWISAAKTATCSRPYQVAGLIGGHSIFWVWNALFLAVVYLGILPLVGVPLFLSVVAGEVPLRRQKALSIALPAKSNRGKIPSPTPVIR